MAGYMIPIAVAYALYGLLSLCLMALFRVAVVLPHLRQAEKLASVNTWSDAFKWGFFYLWMYFTAIVLLIPYRVLFAVLRVIIRVDLRKSWIWTDKEKRFFHATPKTLLEEWLRDYFAKYYPTAFQE